MKIFFISTLIIILCFSSLCMGKELPFKDITKEYPVKQDTLFYILYINGEPFKAPYIKIENNVKEEVIYFPAETLLNALGVNGTYDSVKDKLIINNQEVPKEYAAIGRDIKTNEKILYLSFKDILKFLNLPIRTQENAIGISIYTRTDGLSTNPQNNTNIDNSKLTWLNSVQDGQTVAQSKGKRILVKFGATW